MLRINHTFFGCVNRKKSHFKHENRFDLCTDLCDIPNFLLATEMDFLTWFLGRKTRCVGAFPNNDDIENLKGIRHVIWSINNSRDIHYWVSLAYVLIAFRCKSFLKIDFQDNLVWFLLKNSCNATVTWSCILCFLIRLGCFSKVFQRWHTCRWN